MGFMKDIDEPLPKLEPISGQDAFNDLVDYLMGKNYYIVDPLPNYQANALILEEIKKAYPRPLKNRLWKRLSIKLIKISKKLDYLSENIH